MIRTVSNETDVPTVLSENLTIEYKKALYNQQKKENTVPGSSHVCSLYQHRPYCAVTQCISIVAPIASMAFDQHCYFVGFINGATFVRAVLKLSHEYMDCVLLFPLIREY
jgi:hypothetical protein